MMMVPVAAASQIRFSSLEELWSYADRNALPIKIAKAGETTSAITVKQSYGSLLPTIQANGAFTDNIHIQPTLIPASLFNPAAPADSYSEANFGKRYIYNANLAIQWNLFNMQNWFSIKTAKLNNEIESLNIVKAKRTVYEQVANAYYSYLLLQEAEKLFRENVASVNTIYAVAAQKFKEGLIGELTLNTSSGNRERAEKNLEETIYSKQIQLNNLKWILGCNDSIELVADLTKLVIVSDTSSFTPDTELILTQKKMLLAGQQLKIARAGFAPTLSVVYQYNTQVAADDFLKFSNSNTLPQQLWGIRLSVPIFAGNLQKYQVQKAKNDYQLSRSVYEQVKTESGINLTNLMLAQQQSLASLKRIEKILTLHQRNDVHAQRRLNEGVISLDERLKYYTDLNQAEQEYLQKMSDYFIQQYRIKIRQTTFTP